MLYKSKLPYVIAFYKSFKLICIIFLGNNDMPSFEPWNVVIHNFTSYISLYGIVYRDERLLSTQGVFFAAVQADGESERTLSFCVMKSVKQHYAHFLFLLATLEGSKKEKKKCYLNRNLEISYSNNIINFRVPYFFTIYLYNIQNT